MKPKAPRHPWNGWINLYKPYGMTSTHAVTAVKKFIHPTKIGHAGTLDPLATGVLPLALGEATKTVSYMMEAIKTYRFTVQFGVATDTDDMEGSVIKRSDVIPSMAEMQSLLPEFTGTIMQTPPIYSAIRVQGKRAYDLARKGDTPTLAERPVHIHTLECVQQEDAEHMTYEVTCGKGTYVRSLARDIAARAGSCGHVTALHRCRVGSFLDERAISLDALENYAINGLNASVDAWLAPVEQSLDDIPAVHLNAVQVQDLQYGKPCLCDDLSLPLNTPHKGMHEGRLVGIITREQHCWKSLANV